VIKNHGNVTLSLTNNIAMQIIPEILSNSFNDFFNSEKSSGIVLIICTIISLSIANSSLGVEYLESWHIYIFGMSFEHWINDGLMAIFFLLIGLELERELYNGELSKFKDALLPMVAAAGGMLAPALIHYSLNANTPTQAGIGIPMATDIAFALGVLALLGNRIPNSLKVFLVAFAVMDDLGAAIMIALFYTADLSIWYLLAAIGVWAALIGLNRMRVMSLTPYLIGGAIMWWLTLQSGVHATLAGIALAFAIPFTAVRDDETSPSHKLEHRIHKPVAYLILPIFALANTGIVIGDNWVADLTNNNSLGIIAGLTLGKPLGVACLCALAIALGLCKLPNGLRWQHILGASILGGIGFTMSIFITNLAFIGNSEAINAAKMAILLASLMAGIAGFAWLKLFTKPSTESNLAKETLL
jgi:Na+:H+ antiporter, NhaA family